MIACLHVGDRAIVATGFLLEWLVVALLFRKKRL
jgi:hypothetical protein